MTETHGLSVLHRILWGQEVNQYFDKQELQSGKEERWKDLSAE
jgi:hypothetical protein